MYARLGTRGSQCKKHSHRLCTWVRLGPEKQVFWSQSMKKVVECLPTFFEKSGYNRQQAASPPPPAHVQYVRSVWAYRNVLMNDGLLLKRPGSFSRRSLNLHSRSCLLLCVWVVFFTSTSISDRLRSCTLWRRLPGKRPDRGVDVFFSAQVDRCMAVQAGRTLCRQCSGLRVTLSLSDYL